MSSATPLMLLKELTFSCNSINPPQGGINVTVTSTWDLVKYCYETKKNRDLQGKSREKEKGKTISRILSRAIIRLGGLSPDPSSDLL